MESAAEQGNGKFVIRATNPRAGRGPTGQTLRVNRLIMHVVTVIQRRLKAGFAP
jgi:hypothetical protein